MIINSCDKNSVIDERIPSCDFLEMKLELKQNPKRFNFIPANSIS